MHKHEAAAEMNAIATAAWEASKAIDAAYARFVKLKNDPGCEGSLDVKSIRNSFFGSRRGLDNVIEKLEHSIDKIMCSDAEAA